MAGQITAEITAGLVEPITILGSSRRAFGSHKTRRHGEQSYDHKALVTVRVDVARRADKYRHQDLKLAVAQ